MEELLKRHWDGLQHMARALARGWPGAALAEPAPGVVAAVLPGAGSSLANSLICADAQTVAGVLPEVATTYADAGVEKWGVWLMADERPAIEGALTGAGLVLDSVPTAMGAYLEQLALSDGDVEVATTDLATVGRVNDLAYGIPEPRLERLIGGLEPDDLHVYATRDASCVLILGERQGEASVWFVATHPDHQRQGLARRLLTHALREARDERGCTTSTLQASGMGRGVYAAIGYQNLGELELWERRPS